MVKVQIKYDKHSPSEEIFLITEHFTLFYPKHDNEISIIKQTVIFSPIQSNAIKTDKAQKGFGKGCNVTTFWLFSHFHSIIISNNPSNCLYLQLL